MSVVDRKKETNKKPQTCFSEIMTFFDEYMQKNNDCYWFGITGVESVSKRDELTLNFYS